MFSSISYAVLTLDSVVFVFSSAVFNLPELILFLLMTVLTIDSVVFNLLCLICCV